MKHLPRWNRFGAAVIDLFTVQMFGTLAYGILVFFGAPIALERTNIVKDFAIVYLMIAFLIFAAVMYNYLCYRFFSNTFGKMVMRVKVVDDKDFPVDANVLLKREFYKWFMFYATMSLYGLYVVYNIVNYKEMYHDKKAGTHILS